MKTNPFVLRYGRFVPRILIALFLLGGSMPVLASQRQIMEYYIYFSDEYVRQLGRQRYEHAYATREEAEKARQKAALDTLGAAESFLRNSYIKEVPTGRYTSPPPSTPSPGGTPSGNPGPVSPKPPSWKPVPPKPGNPETEDFSRRLKGRTTPASSTSGEEKDLINRLKGRKPTEPSRRPGLNNEQDIQEARIKIAGLKTKISMMQTLLRGFSKSLLLNTSELEAWEKTIDQVYKDAWESGKDLAKNCFFHYSLFGLEKLVQKEIFIKLDKLIFSTDPAERLRLGREILARHLEVDRVKKVVDWGLLGDGFAELLASDDETLKKSLDALLLVYDLMKVTGLSKIDIQGADLGAHFAMGKTAEKPFSKA